MSGPQVFVFKAFPLSLSLSKAQLGQFDTKLDSGNQARLRSTA
jgi:hypothetical protein